MPRHQLDLLADTASIDIWKYEQDRIIAISSTYRTHDFDFIQKELDEALPNNYTIVKHKTDYSLIIPVSKSTKLLILPKVENIAYGEQKFANLDFLNHADNLARMIYFFYIGHRAPHWPFAVHEINNCQNTVAENDTFGNLESFHYYSNQLLCALDSLDEEAFNQDIQLLKRCNVLSDLLSELNIIRGEKDLLIGLVAKLTQQVERSGLAVKEAVALQTSSIERIELNRNMNNFEILLEELSHIFFNALENARKHLFTNKAEQIETFLRHNLARNVQLKEISQQLQISQQSLNAIFKKKYGITIRQRLIHLKVEHAKKLLVTTQLKGKEIAKCLSFADESYFVLTFNKLCGMTPSKYRENHIKTITSR